MQDGSVKIGLGKVNVISVGLNVTPAGNIPYKFVDVPRCPCQAPPRHTDRGTWRSLATLTYIDYNLETNKQ